MKCWWRVVLLCVFLLACGKSPAGAYWGDQFDAPQIIGPGTSVSAGPVLDTLTPELTFNVIKGGYAYIYLFEEDSPLSLGEISSGIRAPIFTSRALSSALKIPAGVLKPGKRYYWRVEVIYALGSRSECVKTSETLYFSTDKAAK